MFWRGAGVRAFCEFVDGSFQSKVKFEFEFFWMFQMKVMLWSSDNDEGKVWKWKPIICSIDDSW